VQQCGCSYQEEAFCSFYDINTPYFQEIVQTAAFQGAKAFEHQLTRAYELRKKCKMDKAFAASGVKMICLEMQPGGGDAMWWD
jgi:hypothetical protein